MEGIFGVGILDAFFVNFVLFFGIVQIWLLLFDKSRRYFWNSDGIEFRIVQKDAVFWNDKNRGDFDHPIFGPFGRFFAAFCHSRNPPEF